MIKDKNDLRIYLDADKKALGISGDRPPVLGMEVWKFQIALRNYEYYYNRYVCMGGMAQIPNALEEDSVS